jgi:hypothetical protein
MGSTHSLYQTINDIEKQENNTDNDSKRKKVLSDKNILNIRGILLENEIYNNIVDKKKREKNNILLRKIIQSQKDNILQLQTENDILRNDVEMYKTLYYNLSKND